MLQLSGQRHGTVNEHPKKQCQIFTGNQTAKVETMPLIFIPMSDKPLDLTGGAQPWLFYSIPRKTACPFCRCKRGVFRQCSLSRSSNFSLKVFVLIICTR